MEQMNESSGKFLKKNKGFSIYVGDNYVGYIVINETKIPQESIAKLLVPENMKTVLASAELRVFSDKEKDTSYLDDILGASKNNSPTAIPSTVRQFEDLDN